LTGLKALVNARLDTSPIIIIIIAKYIKKLSIGLDGGYKSLNAVCLKRIKKN